jgi:hypothetical protein
MRLNEVITKYPHLVCRELLEGRRIVKADDNKMHCVCFTCIDNMMTEPVGVLLSTGKKDNGIFPPKNSIHNPIEKCTWDDVIVTTTLTNAVSQGKKGEPLKSSINRTSMEAGMQSQVLALVTAKNAVLAHVTASQLVAVTMTNTSSLGVILRKYWSVSASVRVCICPHGITVGVLIASIVLKFSLYIDIVFLFAEPIF